MEITGRRELIWTRWCGLGEDYCTAPDCQLNYGSGCDGNQKPSGTDTSKIARPKLGRVQYGGVGIYDCVVNGDIALTFDDGPYDYTEDLLDKLAVRGRGPSPTWGEALTQGRNTKPKRPSSSRATTSARG